MYTAAKECLRRCEIDISQINCIIPHQANRRIIEAVGERLGAKPEQIFMNLEKYGNTSAASVAIALDEAVGSGRIKRGDLVLMMVFGAGLTWGAAPAYLAADLPAFPARIATAPLVVAAGRALKDAGFEVARRLAARLGGALAGDVSALDAGWIDEEQLVDITGQSIAPKLYLALGISGETTHFMAIQGAGTIVAVQADPTAPIAQVADWNIFADPAQFAQALLDKLGA